MGSPRSGNPYYSCISTNIVCLPFPCKLRDLHTLQRRQQTGDVVLAIVFDNFRRRDWQRADEMLLVVESVIPPGNEPFGGKFLDLVMLLIPGGKERTEAEYRTLFREAGFDLSKIVSTGSEVSAIEASKR